MKKSGKILISIMMLISLSGCNTTTTESEISTESTAESLTDSKTEENTDTPSEALTDRNISDSVTINGVTVTVSSVTDVQTSTGSDAYEVSITYRNNSGKSLTINPYDWSTVLHNGSDKAHVGGNCSFHLDNIPDGEEWTGVVTLWKDDDTEKIKFESSDLNFLQDDKKSATWIIVSEEEITEPETEEVTTEEPTKPETEEITTEEETVATTETDPPTEPPTPAPTEPPATQPLTAPPAPEPNVLQFVLNLETSCVHIDANCSAAEKILPENYTVIEIWDNELANYAGIYWACGKCSKLYSDELPKF